MIGENLIFGAIGFILGGITGGYFAGKYFAKDFKGRIEELEQENAQLRAELREKTDKQFREREKAATKAETKVDRNLDGLRERLGEHPDTATIERLSEEYRSDEFNAHFADRACPDDSDDVGEDDGKSDDDSEDDPRPSAEEVVNSLSKSERRKLRKDGYLKTGDGRTLMTKAFAEALVKFEAGMKYFDDSFDIHLRDKTSDDPDEEEELAVEMISVEQFKKDIQVKDCSTYTYYQEDGILVDDMTQEVETDQEGILGKAAMEVIDDTTEDALYINNEPDDMLYEIVVDHNMSYYRDVLGF